MEQNYSGIDFKSIVQELFEGVYIVDKNRKILFWNEGAERISGYSDDEMVGDYCRNNRLMHVDSCGTQLCKTRCPMKAAIDTGELQNGDVFLHHKNGHRVRVLVKSMPIHENTGDIVGAVEWFREISDEEVREEELEELRKQALLDPLTKVGNRRFGEMVFDGMINALSRHGEEFGVLFFDIDHFKKFNDTYGHSVGDQVLQFVANTLKLNIRSYDTAIRWGGEEFAVLLKNVNQKSLKDISEKLRTLVEQSFIRLESKKLSVTVSIGATMAEGNDTKQKMLERADALMYEAKKNGRNQVVVG